MGDEYKFGSLLESSRDAQSSPEVAESQADQATAAGVDAKRGLFRGAIDAVAKRLGRGGQKASQSPMPEDDSLDTQTQIGPKILEAGVLYQLGFDDKNKVSLKLAQDLIVVIEKTDDTLEMRFDPPKALKLDRGDAKILGRDLLMNEDSEYRGQISGKHFYIGYNQDGTVTIMDVGSKNGTTLPSNRVTELPSDQIAYDYLPLNREFPIVGPNFPAIPLDNIESIEIRAQDNPLWHYEIRPGGEMTILSRLDDASIQSQKTALKNDMIHGSIALVHKAKAHVIDSERALDKKADRQKGFLEMHVDDKDQLILKDNGLSNQVGQLYMTIKPKMPVLNASPKLSPEA